MIIAAVVQGDECGSNQCNDVDGNSGSSGDDCGSSGGIEEETLCLCTDKLYSSSMQVIIFDPKAKLR